MPSIFWSNARAPVAQLIGKRIWPEFRRPRFKFWLNLVSFSKTSFITLKVSYEYLVVWHKNRWKNHHLNHFQVHLYKGLYEWFVSHITHQFCFVSRQKDSQTDRQNGLCTYPCCMCLCACGVTNLMARATYHSTIALVLASNEMSLQLASKKNWNKV